MTPARIAFATLLASAFAALAGPPPDGFIYPGAPGSEGVADYFREGQSYRARRLPPHDLSKDPSVAWMPGRWRVTRRDFSEDKPSAPGQPVISEAIPGEANVSITTGGAWVQVDARYGGRESWHFLGHDGRRWVLHCLTRPGHLYPEALYATGGSPDGRMTFGPITFTTTAGRTLTDRVVFVREAPDRFRIVIEGRVASGPFVAMDDYLFER